MANVTVNYELNHFPVTEDQIKNFYQRNQRRWEEAKARVILVGFKRTAGTVATSSTDLEKLAKDALSAAHPLNERSEQQAKLLSTQIVAEIRSGADFGELVKKSDDLVSKSSAGEFGIIKSTVAQPADIKEAVLVLNPGQVTEPILQPNGFYIIRVDEKTVQLLDDARVNYSGTSPGSATINRR